MAASGKRKLSQLNLDEFLTSALDSEGDSAEETNNDVSEEKVKTKKVKVKKKKKLPTTKTGEKRNTQIKGKATEHKDQLSRLKARDPEFYKFLKDNDQTLLNFNDSDSSEEEGGAHQLPDHLEEISDGDASDSEEKPKKRKKLDQIIVSLKMVYKWKAEAKKDLRPRLFHEIAQAFKAAVATTRGDEGDDPSKFKVTDTEVFNALVTFCIRDLFVHLEKKMDVKPAKGMKLPNPSSCALWKKLRLDIKMYLNSVIQLLTCLTEATVCAALLQHVNNTVHFYLCFPKHSRLLLKQAVVLWSTGEETVRVLAFLVLNKVCRHRQDSYLNPMLKAPGGGGFSLCSAGVSGVTRQRSGCLSEMCFHVGKQRVRSQPPLLFSARAAQRRRVQPPHTETRRVQPPHRHAVYSRRAETCRVQPPHRDAVYSRHAETRRVQPPHRDMPCTATAQRDAVYSRHTETRRVQPPRRDMPCTATAQRDAVYSRHTETRRVQPPHRETRRVQPPHIETPCTAATQRDAVYSHRTQRHAVYSRRTERRRVQPPHRDTPCTAAAQRDTPCTAAVHRDMPCTAAAQRHAVYSRRTERHAVYSRRTETLCTAATQRHAVYSRRTETRRVQPPHRETPCTAATQRDAVRRTETRRVQPPHRETRRVQPPHRDAVYSRHAETRRVQPPHRDTPCTAAAQRDAVYSRHAERRRVQPPCIETCRVQPLCRETPCTAATQRDAVYSRHAERRRVQPPRRETPCTAAVHRDMPCTAAVQRDAVYSRRTERRRVQPPHRDTPCTAAAHRDTPCTAAAHRDAVYSRCAERRRVQPPHIETRRVQPPHIETPCTAAAQRDAVYSRRTERRRLKSFLKECKVSNYCKPMRQLLEKIQENSLYISGRRQSCAFGVSDREAVVRWEKETKEEGTPLSRYYTNWKKLRDKEIQLEISGKERMEDLNLPEIKRRKLEKKEEDKKEFKDLFDSDSDSEEGGGGLSLKKVKSKSKNESDSSDHDSDVSSDDEGGEYEVQDDESSGSEGESQDEDEEEEEGGDAGAGKNKKQKRNNKGVQRLSQADLQELAKGGRDIVRDLEFSDDE
ncbi:nucleolar complex protein 2 homolog [Mantella aurantiaca]